jgi:hypothetical protein
MQSVVVVQDEDIRPSNHRRAPSGPHLQSKPEPPWYRFHLLTLLLIAFTACALMSADELLRYRMGPESYDIFQIIVLPFNAIMISAVAIVSESLIRRREERNY